ncbi:MULTISPECIES: AraC family transcriptional regulator [unclassified Pseudomonas]|uniref:AraC family transcriptional regulator n=1 Tax=unclassified Pseudomonas TaxID=196821 RepID=UPI002360FA98|nr:MULTISPECIES: AraC family transcriptional regulator [unclassified Pseudomonas]MDR6178005.1 AraC-like DNA-binding protein [Pseudomonas sp. SORGH_AS_0211]
MTGLPRDSLARGILDEALAGLCRRSGLAPDTLLAADGVQLSNLLLGRERLSAPSFGQLWYRLAQRFDDEFFALGPRPLPAGSFAFLCQSTRLQPTLGDALRQSVDFLRLTLGVDLRLQRNGEQVTLRLAPGSLPGSFAVFTLWLILHGLACWLVGRRLPLEEIRQIAEEPPAELLADYRQRFGSRLSFARGEDCLVLNAAVLGLPIRRTAADARRFIAAAPGNLLVHYRDDASLIARIRTLLRTCAPEDWPDAVSLAEALGLAPATLRRQLAASGQTYQGLKDERRCRLACRQLDQGALPLDELALRLGFADPRSFQRAFRKWTGLSPLGYRQRQTRAG